MSLLEKFSYNKNGYSPEIITDKWQIAFLNQTPDYYYKNIVRADIHKLTDEVFVLLYGKAVLICGEIINDKMEFEVTLLEENIVYNVKKLCWHAIAIEGNTKIIIVENSNTHIDDFEFYNFNNDELENFRSKVEEVLI